MYLLTTSYLYAYKNKILARRLFFRSDECTEKKICIIDIFKIQCYIRVFEVMKSQRLHKLSDNDNEERKITTRIEKKRD